MKPAFISEFQSTTVSVLVFSKTYLARFDVTFFSAVRTLLGCFQKIVSCLFVVFHGLERGMCSKTAASKAKLTHTRALPLYLTVNSRSCLNDPY